MSTFWKKVNLGSTTILMILTWPINEMECVFTYQALKPINQIQIVEFKNKFWVSGYLGSMYNPMLHSDAAQLIPEIWGLALMAMASGSRARVKSMQQPCLVPWFNENGGGGVKC